VEEASTLVGPLLDDVASHNDNERPDETLVLLLQVAVVLKHARAAKALAGRLASVAQLSNVGTTMNICVARHLGDAAVLVGDRAAAHSYYAQAVEAASKIGFRPELALIHLRLAEVLLEEKGGAGRLEAREHLDIATPELRAMHMQPALERVLTLSKTLARSTATVTLANESATDLLTTREGEIASLIAGGLSNHDIAQRLVIAETTVEVHVKHILSKLEFRSRSQVAAWFTQRQSAAKPQV
jgi:ATP/maltotriose-dependent transcriptional regulator MalT